MQQISTGEQAVKKREAQAPWRFGSNWPSDYLRGFSRGTCHANHKLRGPAGKSDRSRRVDRRWRGNVSGNGATRTCPIADGLFERAKQGIINYDFSDPRIVMGHFDPKSRALIGRNIALEMKVLGLRFLGAVRASWKRAKKTPVTSSVFGFRYDTLEGHFERGFEWFLLTKDHATGDVRFKIEAHWRVGAFPNWWSKTGLPVDRAVLPALVAQPRATAV